MQKEYAQGKHIFGLILLLSPAVQPISFRRLNFPSDLMVCGTRATERVALWPSHVTTRVILD